MAFSGIEYVTSKKLKLTDEAGADDMRTAIRGLFPQLTGTFQYMRCTADRQLIVLPDGVDCPAEIRKHAAFRRSALYVRPLMVS